MFREGEEDSGRSYFLSNLLNINIRKHNRRIIPAASSIYQSGYTISHIFLVELGRKTYSSRVTLFNVLLALCKTNFPVVVDPVKLILSIPG